MCSSKVCAVGNAALLPALLPVVTRYYQCCSVMSYPVLSCPVLFRGSGVCLVWFNEDKRTGSAFFVFFRAAMASLELDGRLTNTTLDATQVDAPLACCVVA